MPILTEASCNSGGCHAEGGQQAEAARLSLLGFEPREDYEHIVKEGARPEGVPGGPEQSLLLLKAANVVPHGGGKRLDPSSGGYQRLARWISEGMVLRQGDRPRARLDRGSAEAERVEDPREQQLKVLAHYSDGSDRGCDPDGTL